MGRYIIADTGRSCTDSHVPKRSLIRRSCDRTIRESAGLFGTWVHGLGIARIWLCPPVRGDMERVTLLWGEEHGKKPVCALCPHIIGHVGFNPVPSLIMRGEPEHGNDCPQRHRCDGERNE